jgi:hypothetical protein
MTSRSCPIGASATIGRTWDLTVGDEIVSIATAEPDPGESLTTGVRRLAAALVGSHLRGRSDPIRIETVLPSGRPVATDSRGLLPVAMSLAHDAGLMAAAAAERCHVGIDVIAIESRSSGLDYWLDSDERRWERRTGAPGLLWAAKESAYKAARLDTPFRPREITVAPEGGDGFRFTWSSRWHVVTGSGRFMVEGGYLVAVATASRHSQPRTVSAAERAACS